MKKGKWNYTEDILYKVVMVRILAEPATPMHWQNAFVGEDRQAVLVQYDNQEPFLIDNQDGSGLLKIAKGGGPDSYSAHIESHELLHDVPELEWYQYDRAQHLIQRGLVDVWQQENFPEEYERMTKLKEMLQSRNYHIDRKGTMQPGKRHHD